MGVGDDDSKADRNANLSITWYTNMTSAPPPPTTRLDLKPKAGFCIKSSILQDAAYKPVFTDSSLSAISSDGGAPSFPKGLKCFVNIAWDENVPPPPEGSEEAIQHAMKGQEVDELNPDGWYVPVVVSEGRLDKDKGR